MNNAQRWPTRYVEWCSRLPTIRSHGSSMSFAPSLNCVTHVAVFSPAGMVIVCLPSCSGSRKSDSHRCVSLTLRYTSRSDVGGRLASTVQVTEPLST